MNSAQIQLRLTLSDQLYDFLQGQASRFGLTVTQVVKHMIVEKAQKEEFPTYRASAATEQAAREALENIDKATVINNSKELDKYFANL